MSENNSSIKLLLYSLPFSMFRSLIAELSVSKVGFRSLTTCLSLRFLTTFFLRAYISSFFLDEYQIELAQWVPWQSVHQAIPWTYSFYLPLLHPFTLYWYSLAEYAPAHIVHLSDLFPQLFWRWCTVQYHSIPGIPIRGRHPSIFPLFNWPFKLQTASGKLFCFTFTTNNNDDCQSVFVI